MMSHLYFQVPNPHIGHQQRGQGRGTHSLSLRQPISHHLAVMRENKMDEEQSAETDSTFYDCSLNSYGLKLGI